MTNDNTSSDEPDSNGGNGESPAVRVVELDRELSIGAVGDLKNYLAVLLDAPGDISLDGSAVEQVDTASLQLLAAFANRLERDSKALSWKAASENVQNAADLLGLTEAIGLTNLEDQEDDDDDGLCPVF